MSPEVISVGIGVVLLLIGFYYALKWASGGK